MQDGAVGAANYVTYLSRLMKKRQSHSEPLRVGLTSRLTITMAHRQNAKQMQIVYDAGCKSHRHGHKTSLVAIVMCST